MTRFAFPFVITIVTFDVGVDEYGNPVPSAAHSATAWGDLQPFGANELGGLDETESEEVRFFLEPTAVVTAGSTLTSSSRPADTFAAVGPPEPRLYGGPLDYIRIRGRRAR